MAVFLTKGYPMHTQRLVTCTAFLICMLFQSVLATISLRVFSRDEGLTENNIAKPRIYIQNLGTESISDFYCYYYFTTEQNRRVVLDDYYTPDASITLEELSNGNYRVKFSFTGVTLDVGQILPNTGGQAIGLHYSDWSAWDKTNDMSNTGLSTFALNENIPVYSSTGELLYGNTSSDPGNPLQPPVVFTETGDYAVLSKDYTDIKDRVTVKGGNVGSGLYTEIGANAVVDGSVFSGGTMFLRSNDTIKGDAAAGEVVNTQNGSVVTGTTRSHAQLYIPQIMLSSVTAGTNDITVSDDGTIDLQPGSYRDFHAYSRSTVTMHPGDYTFNQFYLETDVKIILKVSNTDRINLNVSTNLRFGDRTKMSFEQGTAFPYSIKIYSSQIGQVSIGTDCQIYGNVICPVAEVYIYSRSYLNGAVYGKKVVIEPDVVVCKPPLLQDLWHSDWAYSPPFEPSILEYKAIVPNATSLLTITSGLPSGVNLTINGQNPASPISVSDTINDIALTLSNSALCGHTTYNLKVIKSDDYQIFVNDNSPCQAGNEDGNSWETAYKNLQQAINRALVNGKEIWLAEGFYKPIQRTDANEPRSATFLIYSGVEIKGGFKGVEAEDKPQGSTYNTILTGDLTGNDSSITTWPPSGNDTAVLNDNVYHVITITGNNRSIAVHLKGFLVENGNANGAGINSNGAGIYVKNCIPTLEQIAIQKNIASSSGAGLYVSSGIKSMVNCLFKDNCSLSGNGAGLYLVDNRMVLIDGSIFDGNINKDTSSLQGCSALYCKNSQIDIVNSVFTRNYSSSINSTIFNDNSFLTVTNCTFAYNNSTIGAVSIKNAVGSTVAIVNSILWNGNDRNELAGNGFTVNYSCITKGYIGAGNTSTDPLFKNPTQPEGNLHYGGSDDGLELRVGSPAIGVSKDSFPNVDITKTYRVVNADGRSDMGAYAFIPPATNDQNSDAVFGYFNAGGAFILPDKIRAYIHFDSEWGYILAKNSIHVLYARLLVDNNDETRKINNGPVTIVSKDSSGNILFSKRIIMERAGNSEMIRGKLVFYSKYPLMFLEDLETATAFNEAKQNDNLYFIYGNAESVNKFEITAYTKDYR